MVKIENQRVLEAVRVKTGINLLRDVVPTEASEKILVTLPVDSLSPMKVARPSGGAGTSPASEEVPEGKRWRIVYVYQDFTATATVGTRRPVLEVLDKDGAVVVFKCGTGETVSASEQRFFLWNGSVGVIANYQGFGHSPTYVKAGQTIQVHEENEIEDLDTSVVHIVYVEEDDI